MIIYDLFVDDTIHITISSKYNASFSCSLNLKNYQNIYLIKFMQKGIFIHYINYINYLIVLH